MIGAIPVERDRWQRLIVRLLPWYDAKIEAARNQHTEQMRQSAIAARMKAEQVRKAYKLAGDRVER
jgi:hypothetical protein